MFGNLQGHHGSSPRIPTPYRFHNKGIRIKKKKTRTKSLHMLELLYKRHSSNVHAGIIAYKQLFLIA
jgi:hypothetical protein